MIPKCMPERLLTTGLRPRSGLASFFLAVVPAGELAVSEKFCVNQLNTWNELIL